MALMTCATSNVPFTEQSLYKFGLMAECGSDQLIFQFSPYLENQAVIEVSMMVHTSRSLLDVIRSVQEQYQVSFTEVPSIAPILYREYEADLGGGRRILVSTTLADLFTPLLRVDPGSAVRTSPKA